MRWRRRRPLWCWTTCGGPSPRPPSPCWVAAAKTPKRTLPTCRSGRSQVGRRCCPRTCCAAGGSRSPEAVSDRESAEAMLAAAPEVMARFADRSLQLPYTAFPLSRIREAWAHTGRSRAVVVPD